MPAQTWRVMSKTLATLNVLASKMLMMASSLKHGCPEVSPCYKRTATAFLLDVADMNVMRGTVMYTCLREACGLPLGV